MLLHEKFNFAAKILVEANLNRQEEIRNNDIILSSRNWAKDFCTVKISGGRGCGSSTTAVDLSLKMFKNSIIIVNSFASMMLMKKMRIDMSRRLGIDAPCFIVTNKHLERTRGMSPDAIIIDGADLMTESEIDEIYNYFSYFSANNNFSFIILG